MSWELAKLYREQLPDPDQKAKLEAGNSLYEQDDNGRW